MLPQTDSRSGTATRRPCRGAGCQKKLSSKKEGKVFFLDIPFYRTHYSGTGRENTKGWATRLAEQLGCLRDNGINPPSRRKAAYKVMSFHASHSHVWFGNV